MFALLLLDAALHVDEGSIHPLGEALLDLPVVLLHLVWIRTNISPGTSLLHTLTVRNSQAVNKFGSFTS